MSSLRSFGQYRLLRKLAAGGMAEIFLAKQVGPHGFERDVVIKRLRPEHHARTDYVSMFFDEARLAARITHPNVVQIHDLGMIAGHHFMCMEYLPGEDLSQLLRAAAAKSMEVPAALAARIVAEAAQGLHYAHELTDEAGNPLKIVHRDVTPSNLFLTYDGQVKVLDFGVARAESRITVTGDGLIKGKAAYAAPEMVQGARADRRCDVYMLGLVLYEALTGIQPFVADTPLQMLHAVLVGKVPKLSTLREDLPEALVEIIEKAMARDPDARFQSAGELAAALERFLGDYTTSSANSGLRAFIRSLVPQKRILERSNVPSLRTLQARGVAVMGFTDPQAALPGAVAPLARTPTPAQTLQPPALPAPSTTPRDGNGHWAVATASVPERSPALAAAPYEAQTQVVPPPAPLPAERRVTQAPAIAIPVLLPARAPAAVPAPVKAQAELPPGSRNIRRPRWLLPLAGSAAALMILVVGAAVALQVSKASAQSHGGSDTPPPVMVTAPEPTVAPTSDSAHLRSDPNAKAEADADADADEAIAEVAKRVRAARKERVTAPAGPEPVRRVRSMGMLTLDTVPWSRVYVDHKLVGETPVVELLLPEGTHQIRLVNPETGTERTVQVKVRGNETTAMRLQL